MLTRCLATIVAVASTCVLTGLVTPPQDRAQSVPVVKLKPAQARLSEDFSRIVGVREPHDGRALLADAVEKRVVVADRRAHRSTIWELAHQAAFLC